MDSSSKSLNGDNSNDSTYPDLANGHTSQEACYVRALYPFTSTESSSLAFDTGDLIRVLTKLESGWWDGLLRGERGWFPSNYVEEVEIVQSDDDDDDDDDREEVEDVFNKARDLAEYEQTGAASPVIGPAATIDTARERDESVFWIPQATNEGRVYFFNTVTGASQWDLPLSNLKHPSVSKVIKNFETPLTTNIRAPPVESPALHAREGSVEVLNDEFSQTLDNRALQRNARWSSSTSGWRDAMGNDIFAENSPISEDRESEILLFAMPETRHESPSRLGSGLVQVSSNNSDSPNIQNETRDSSMPLASASSTRDDLASNIAETVYRETTRSKDLAQWSLRSSTILETLSANVVAGKTEEYRTSCANMRDLVSEMLQTYGLCSSGRHTANVAEAGRAQALVKTQPEEILRIVTKLMHAGHVAGTEWSSTEEAQKMLSEATALHSTILSFNTNAIRYRPVAKLLQPTALSTRSTAAGWQGNGLANDGLHHACGLQLSSETVVDVEHYAREIQAELRICKAKLKQHGPDSLAIFPSIILRDATEAIKFVRQLLSSCEQIDLSPLDPTTGGMPVRSPTTADFAKSKQMLYDASGSLLLAAQGMTNPTETTVTPLGVYDKAKVLESAITEVDDAVQATVMHVEFMVQEAVSRFSSNAAAHQDAEIILESVPMNIDSRAPGNPDDSVSAKSPMLRSGSLLGSVHSTTRSPASRSTSPHANLWYLDNELDSDLSYDSKGNVKAGTLLALVERLTRHDLLDAVYNNTFLLTYRSFTTAAELSSLLRNRFLIQPPQGLSPAQFEVWVQRKQNPIQLRVFNILKSWMENFFMEPPDEVTKEWLTQLKELARTAMSQSIPSSSVLVKLIEMRIVQGDVPFRKLIPSHSGTAPNPIVPRNLKKIRLLDLDALEVARQLTLMESNLYNKIKPTECLDKSWSKPNAAEGAENIKAMILHSNQITAWVAEAILYQTDLKKRVNLIKHFVFIAEKCRVLNNFSTLTAIISGLNSAPIHRLRRTWDLLNARVAMSAEDLNRLMNSSKNFSQYREALHSTLPPCVPFLGVYLTDLTFIEDGNPNMSVKARHLINFSKRQKTADVIRDIQQYQAVPYSLQAVPEIQNYIKSCMDITRDISELYHISLEREPREREDEKIARLLQESGFL